MLGAGAFIVEFTLHVLPAVASQFPEDIGAVCNVAKGSSELTRNFVLLLSYLCQRFCRISCRKITTLGLHQVDLMKTG